MASASLGDDVAVRVVVAAPRPSLFAESVAWLLSRSEGFRAGPLVVGDPPAGEAADEADAVLVEVDGGEGARPHLGALRGHWASVPLVLLAPRGGPWCARLCGEVGAAGWLDADIDPAGLTAALREVARTGRLPRPAGDRNGHIARRPADDGPRSLLSAREREVLDLLGTGCRIDQIAERLSISRHTVRTHVRNVIGKLGVRSQVEAVAAARRGADVDGRPLATARAAAASAAAGGPEA